MSHLKNEDAYADNASSYISSWRDPVFCHHGNSALWTAWRLIPANSKLFVKYKYILFGVEKQGYHVSELLTL